MTLLETQLFPDEWQSVYTANIQAQAVPNTANRVYPIGSIGIPVLLSNPLIAVSMRNDALPPTWRFAGHARQAINAGLLVGAATTASFATKPLLLNKLNLLYFPTLTAEWALSIDIPKWILEVTITVFEYTGALNTTADEIEEINAKLDELWN